MADNGEKDLNSLEPLELNIQPNWTLKSHIVRLFRQKKWTTAHIDEIADSLPERNQAHKESITSALAHASVGRRTFDSQVDRALFKFEGGAQYTLLPDVNEFDALEHMSYPAHIQAAFDIVSKRLVDAGKLPEKNIDRHNEFLRILRKNPELVQFIVENKKRAIELASLSGLPKL